MATPPPAISKLGEDDDLLAEVLCRLPDTKSAWRCKSVCKRWNSVISTPYFSRRFISHHHHRIRSESEPPLLISSAVRGPIWSFLPLPTEASFSAFVADCFKDLLLVGFTHCEDDGPNHHRDELSRSYLVCNPFTKQWVALPLAPKTSSRAWTARLACKPCNSVTTTSLDLGFTYHIEHRFRVVRLHHQSSETAASKLDVFCSRTAKWTEIALDVSMIPRWHLLYNVVSLNGNLYWKAYRTEVIVGWNPFSCLDDDISPLAAPALIDASEVEPSSGVCSSQGGLYMIFPWLGTKNHALILWRREEGEEGGCWRRLYQVSLNKLITRSGVIKRRDQVTCRVVGQDLERPEVIFLKIYIHGRNPYRYERAMVSCNLKREDIESFVYRKDFVDKESLFQPKVTFWPTVIPNYHKLRDSYDGSYNCWLRGREQ